VKTVGEELADVALFLFSLAAMTGVDLQAEVEAKIEKNASPTSPSTGPSTPSQANSSDKRPRCAAHLGQDNRTPMP
jgi:hypothetical protein